MQPKPEHEEFGNTSSPSAGADAVSIGLAEADIPAELRRYGLCAQCCKVRMFQAHALRLRLAAAVKAKAVGICVVNQCCDETSLPTKHPTETNVDM